MLAYVVSALLLVVSLSAGIASGRNAEQREPAVGLELIADGLTSPVTLVAPPDGSGRLFVVDQIVVIRVLRPDGTLARQSFLDVRDRMPMDANRCGCEK
jgi:hypothetical protein